MDPTKQKSLHSTLNRLHIEPESLFTDSFINKVTDYTCFEEMLVNNDWLNSKNDGLDHGITVGEADEVILKNSKFKNWQQFLQKALKRYWEEGNKDRRRYNRYECDIQVKIYMGEKEFCGTVLDISKKGLKLETKEDVPETDIIEIKFPEETPEKFPSSLMGNVQWMHQDAVTRLGIQILTSLKAA